mmetsp:Transcript_11148/g.24527  ORF Transcript_11148/g.24527 Transcript_11148/m.24527 type:complete len:204 (-) Transcript_11148:29-640(-)
MSRRHRIVLMPIFLWNLIQHWHCQHFRIHHYPVKNMLQPVLVGNNMCFKENDHRCSCHLDSFHFCTHQTLSLIKSKNPHFGRQSFQLRFFGVLVPIGYPNVLVHQLIWCKMQNCLHGAFHMHPLLSKPRDNDGNCMVREVFPLVFATPRWTSIRRVWKTFAHVSFRAANHAPCAQGPGGYCKTHRLFGDLLEAFREFGLWGSL